MYTKLSIPERLKDLRVVDKHLTLEQLAEQGHQPVCDCNAGRVLRRVHRLSDGAVGK